MFWLFIKHMQPSLHFLARVHPLPELKPSIVYSSFIHDLLMKAESKE